MGKRFDFCPSHTCFLPFLGSSPWEAMKAAMCNGDVSSVHPYLIDINESTDTAPKTSEARLEHCLFT